MPHRHTACKLTPPSRHGSSSFLCPAAGQGHATARPSSAHRPRTGPLAPGGWQRCRGPPEVELGGPGAPGRGRAWAQLAPWAADLEDCGGWGQLCRGQGSSAADSTGGPRAAWLSGRAPSRKQGGSSTFCKVPCSKTRPRPELRTTAFSRSSRTFVRSLASSLLFPRSS